MAIFLLKTWSPFPFPNTSYGFGFIVFFRQLCVYSERKVSEGKTTHLIVFRGSNDPYSMILIASMGL